MVVMAEEIKKKVGFWMPNEAHELIDRLSEHYGANRMKGLLVTAAVMLAANADEGSFRELLDKLIVANHREDFAWILTEGKEADVRTKPQKTGVRGRT